MKKLFTTIMVLAVSALTLFAQNTEPEKMVVKMKGGATTTFVINDIEDITFEQGDQPEKPEPPVADKVYKIELNNDFSTGLVQKIMCGDVQVAEMANEYVRYYVADGDKKKKVYDDKLVVVYPMGADGKADLTNGIAANGAKISWDVKKNVVASYTPAEGDGALTTIYLNNAGQFVDAADAADALATTQDAYVVVDKRGALDFSPFTYHVVKVGTQYWFEENLHAKLFRDGSSITQYSSKETTAWSANTTGAYHVYNDDMTYNWLEWGALYNGYAVLSDKGLTPEGWAVTTVADWNSLKSYLASSQSVKVKTEKYWTKVGTNITGLDIMPGGYFSKPTADNGEGSVVYFWNTDKSYDALSKSDVLGTTAIQNSIATTGTHDYTFGHYVRCIRK